MAKHVLAVRTLFDQSSFNWVFVLWYLVSGILALLFLFYFNRLIADIASLAIRTYTWHYYRVHVDIQALQFSPLAGRLFFKGVHYHGQNETILIQDGYITWRYWLRHIRESDIGSGGTIRCKDEDDTNEKKGPETDVYEGGDSRHTSLKELPCRVLLKSRGIQWFIYNRSPAYDAILQRLNEEQVFDDGATPSTSKRESIVRDARTMLDRELAEPLRVKREHEGGLKIDDDLVDKESGSTITRESTQESNAASSQPDSSLPSLLNILPIKIECNKGAIVMGNPSTRSILTATFASAAGTIDARGSRPLDQYKQLIDFEFIHPLIQFKHNREYKHSQVEEGGRLTSKVDQDHEKKLGWHQRLRPRQRFERMMGSLRSCMPYGKGSIEDLSHAHPRSKGSPDVIGNDTADYGTNRWLGLTRYLDDDDEIVEQERWKGIEYAQFPVIVDSPAISMSFYWDVPGLVQPPTASSRVIPSKYKADINGDVPPDWGIDLRIKGGTVNYGPWADRQRADLQAVFFPTLYKDATPGKALTPGQSRVSTELRIMIDIEEQTTLRIPTREDSKDWRWKGRVIPSKKKGVKEKRGKSHAKGNKGQETDHGTESRPFGWLDVRVLPDSTISFTMDLVAKDTGYNNGVNLDLRGIEVSSSVNHGLLLRSQSQVISCDLGYPLIWNQLRKWHIDIQDENIELFMLRDHIFLLTDLISDWSTGPPSDFHTFVPFEYLLNFRSKNFRLFVNANDSNIIDNPADVDDNTFVVIWGQELDVDLTIPLRNFRPSQNKISFDAQARDGGFELLTPPWNTQHAFLPSRNVAALKDLRIDGSYNYNTTTSPALTDILLMNVHGLSLKVELYGFLIRYLMKIKDNYFGDDIHFRTVGEYQDLVIKGDDAPSRSEQRSRPSNDLDVILSINATNICAQLPSQLYSAAKSVNLEILSVSADLRITNYYMDLAVTSSPIAISQASRAKQSLLDVDEESGVQICIQGLEVFGHRLFGLPPTEPTYVCNWDFDVGSISGDCSIDFLHSLTQALACFGFAFADAENALAPHNPPVIHDVTFLRAKIQPIAIALRVEESALLLKSQEMKVDFNDWAGSRFSGHVWVHIPEVAIFLLDTAGAFSIEGRLAAAARTHAYFCTSIDFRSVSRKPEFESHRKSQQDHIALHDMRTQRTPWLIHKPNDHHHRLASAVPAKVRPPAMCFPMMPTPIITSSPAVSRSTSILSASTLSIQSHHGPNRKSSFLTSSSLRKDSRHQARIVPRGAEAPAESTTGLHSQDGVPLSQAVETAKNHSRNSSPKRAATTSRRDSSHLGFTFTSPYKRPHFPVLETIIDRQHVPELPRDLSSDTFEGEDEPIEDLNAQLETGTAQSNLMVNLNQGVRMFCTPKALFLATQLQEGFQAHDPETLLDNLQTDVMKEVLGVDTKRDKGSSVVSLRLHTPFIGLNFINTLSSKPNTLRRQERYELSLENITTTMRSLDTVSTDAPAEVNHEISLHVVFDRLECSARESVEGHRTDQAVIGLSLVDPVFWFHQGTGLSADLQFRDFEIASASRKVDHISSLVRQTMLLAEKLAGRFSRNAKSQAHRLRLLLLLLTQQGDDIPDPPFLSGASYVLRSAVNHLRSSDSWKMMSRLRYVLQDLPSHSLDSIRAQCADTQATCPPNASAYVIKHFDHWRTWDLAHVRSSILMQKVFGELLLSPAQRKAGPAPTKVAIRAGRISLLIDPGPHQNEIVLTRSVTNLALFQRTTFSKKTPGKDLSTLTDSTIEVYVVNIALRLNWGLCELVESVLQTLSSPESTRSQLQIETPAPAPLKQGTNWHAVLCLEVGILNVDTLALKVISLCQGLHSSIVLQACDNASRNGLTSIAINADAATSEIRSHTAPLTLYKLRRPSVVGSRDSSGKDGVEKPWRFVGSGKEVSFQVLASILEITEVANSFVRNEVTLVNSWVKAMKPQSSQPKSSASPSIGPPRLPRAHVTLILDSYIVGTTILPTLNYQIHGTGGRTSIRSGTQRGFGIDIDVDVRDHAHIFKGGIEEDAAELSALHIPPISGRLILDLAPKQKSVVLRALAEPIVFEASAIHSMITAINRPEIINLGKSAGHEIALVRENAEQIFNTNGRDNKTEVTEASAPTEPILYDAYATLAGFAIHASTPDSSSADHAAELEFNMGRIQLKAANNAPKTIETVNYPEIEARLDAIRLNLMRSNENESIPCGEVAMAVVLRSTSKAHDEGKMVPFYQVAITDPKVNIYTETASVIVAIAGHLQDTLKTIEVSDEFKSLGKLGYARLRSEPTSQEEAVSKQPVRDPISSALFNAMYSLELADIRVTWKVGDSIPSTPGRETEDLVLSFTKIDLATRRENSARLTIQNFQLQMVPQSMAPTTRSANSALLPEVVFNVAYLSTAQDRRFAFQAKGKSLDLRLTSQFILPASDIRRSIASATDQVRTATASWYATTPVTNGKRMNPLGSNKVGSLLVDADFAGAVVYIQGRSVRDPQSAALNALRGGRLPQHGRYNQFTPENANSSTTLRAPGIAVKVEYKTKGVNESSLNAEFKVDASSNVLYPTMVPLVMEISSSVKEIVGETDSQEDEPQRRRQSRLPQPRFLEDDRLKNTDPVAIFGNVSLNFGLRICRQEFSLSCQPIARVAATACFEDIYITVNTVKSSQHGKFFSISAAVSGLHASVQHVYSRESTGGFHVDSIVLSLMNSKHVSNTNGISAILKVSPMKVQINAKQSQDFLLFREIWVPAEIRHSSSVPDTSATAEPQAFIVQRYQQVAAAGAFPWTATVSIAELDVQLDLGQSLGKSAFIISDFWVSSKKSSDWEQNLCLGFDKVSVDSTGRMSGTVEMQDFKVRTSIQWPLVENAHNQTPLIQASIGLDQLHVKAGFEYQPFLIAHITTFEFLMYNVRDPDHAARDRLVGMLDGDKVQVFCTTTSASQALALYQAFQRLIQEKQTAYETSLRDIEKFLRRKSSINPFALRAAASKPPADLDLEVPAGSLKLQTDVVVTLKTVSLGAFPSTFFDNQIFKVEALDASARFAVVLDNEKIHSTLGLILGQLRVALAGVTRASVPKTLGEVSVADVVSAATGSRGGTILKVPRLVATMQTWQSPNSTQIDYIFKSSFQGKVDVGWNYSRITYIRGMWTSHARGLAQRLGKPLPQSSVQITGLEDGAGGQKSGDGEQEKITAVVDVPQSKYQYTALQPAIIETPQLRDMGEATPPLEWVGLHRDRLPNLTHQIVIVTLLQLAGEVDDAYTRILGSS